MAVTEAAMRRTQAERTATMRARLLDATVACLVDVGYAGTTTTEVARRAGVSRGAQVHHFPTKQALVLAAIEHVLERRRQEFRAAFVALAPDKRSLTTALDLLWSMYREPSFAAWLELGVAARTDDELRPHFQEMVRRFGDQVAAIFVEFYPASPDPRFSRLGVEFAFALLDGLGVQCHLGVDVDSAELIGMLKSLATMFATDLGGTP
ncbi:MAG: TetR/AcrR family transcriptional regulator [Acidimicrobiales bacterium]